MNKKNKYAEVILDIATYEIDHAFDYMVPPKLIKDASIGCMVLVPFKSRLEIGYIVSLKDSTAVPQKKIKPVKKIISKNPIFDDNKLKLINWLKDYYIQPAGKAFKLFLPPGRKYKIVKVWHIKKSDIAEKEFKKIGATGLIKQGKIFPKDIKKDISAKAEKSIKKLSRKKAIEADYILDEPKVKLKYKDFVILNRKRYLERKDKINWEKSYRQKQIIEYLLKKGKVRKENLIKETNSSYNSLNSLVKKKILIIRRERVHRNFTYSQDSSVKDKIILNKYQKQCIHEIEIAIEGKTSNFLIQGVTGSGKTEVYIEACKKVLKKGKRALILTPEISLTPQLYKRFEATFKDLVTVFHSNMDSAERYERWLQIRDNKYKIIIGTRSALFAPINNLGLIVIDEEHDPSYKENSSIRYNTQDVALKMGQLLDICIIFGSATPSVKTRFKAENDKNLKVLFIPVKAQTKNEIEKEIVDLKNIDRFKNNFMISRALHAAIRKEIDRGNKIIIFLNRRGYSNFIVCNKCGNVPKCPNCNLALKYHYAGKKLVCHHCGMEQRFFGKCRKCGGENIFLKGFGIQRVEQELKLRFKDIPIIRMDSDVTAKRKSHEKILRSFKATGPSILLGTQMVAKGLDIADVTLVGIINCDHMLELPDFHMYERVYQLIHQVSGRTGRKNKKGKVIVQTYNPGHAVIKNFLDGNYDTFYKEELKNRKELEYPPFSNIVNIIVSGKKESLVIKDINKLFTEVNKVIKIDDRVLGPAPAPFQKINKYFRWHVVIKTKDINGINKKLSEVVKNFKKFENNRLIVDVDPIWVL